MINQNNVSGFLHDGLARLVDLARPDERGWTQLACPTSENGANLYPCGFRQTAEFRRIIVPGLVGKVQGNQ